MESRQHTATTSDRPGITFVVPVNDREMFGSNFLASPCLSASRKPQLLVQENFLSAAAAYNDAMDKSVNDLMIFCHQDVLLPNSWIGELEQTLAYLESRDPRWGVLGSCGMAANGRKGRILGQIYSAGVGMVGAPLEHPAPVQTLDGLLLILRKSSGLRFDEGLPHYHFYGADICLAAAKKGMKSYAIPAVCIHNTQHYGVYPPEYYECYRYTRRRWEEYLPIETTCVKITRFNFPMIKRRLWELSLRHISRKERGATRIADGRRLFSELEAVHPRKRGS